MSVGSIIVSLCAGFFVFYAVSNLSKEKKKALIEEMVTQLIHFIIFIWLGKIVLNFSAFIKSPLAILAYPSDSGAFYMAILFISTVLFYKSKRSQTNVSLLIENFIPVFLVAAFLYEFIDLVWNDNNYSFGNLGLFTFLLLLYLSIRDNVPRLVTVVMLLGWTGGSFVLSLIQPFYTVYGFIMAPWFIGLFFIVNLPIIIYTRFRQDKIH